MKRIKLIGLVTAATLALLGCSGNDNEEISSVESSETITSAETSEEISETTSSTAEETSVASNDVVSDYEQRLAESITSLNSDNLTMDQVTYQPASEEEIQESGIIMYYNLTDTLDTYIGLLEDGTSSLMFESQEVMNSVGGEAAYDFITVYLHAEEPTLSMEDSDYIISELGINPNGHDESQLVYIDTENTRFVYNYDADTTYYILTSLPL